MSSEDTEGQRTQRVIVTASWEILAPVGSGRIIMWAKQKTPLLQEDVRVSFQFLMVLVLLDDLKGNKGHNGS